MELHGPSSDKVHDIFQRVAFRYDLVNDVLSLGIHRLWKRKLIRSVPRSKGMQILDCATGTGDLAISWGHRIFPDGNVIGTDCNSEMLAYAPKKIPSNLDHCVRFEIANAEALPYQSNTFDVVSIAYGIRNIQNPSLAVSEMHRVLKPGGHLLILEFGQPQGILRNPFNFYSRTLLPRIGGWLTKAPDAYEYLQTSSASFPCGSNFLDLVNAAGKWQSCKYEELGMGISYLYSMKKLDF